MLVNLYIENYVLFDKQTLSFEEGFSVVTGDTGAGKSLIIDALGYLCGERLLSNISKDKTKNTYLEGQFTFENPKTLTLLEEHGISHDDIYIVSRDISLDNKSISRINGRSVTLSFLKQLFENELDIHSQRDTQYLLNKTYHLNLLDTFSNHEALLDAVASSYKSYNTIKKEITDLNNSVFNADEIDFIKHQISDIEEVNINEAEYNKLQERLKTINAYENLFNNLNASNKAFNDNGKILESFFDAKSHMSKLQEYSDYTELSERLDSLYFEVADIASEINDHLSNLEFNEYELNTIESRLYDVNRLLKRYGGSFEIFNERYNDMLSKVEKYESKDIILLKLNRNLAAAKEEYLKHAEVLRQSREKNLVLLENQILGNLADLNLENARFKVNLSEKEISRDGIDDVEFLVAMNKGASLEPLIRVASGGELSRLMLGLKVVFSKLFGVSTVIFDEIDTGVSGSVASSIGYKMHELSKFSQVFSVTHLAQVAACSDHHYHVEKDNTGNFGSTSISKLADSERIEKLAIMSTGIKSDNSMSAAQELYNNSQKIISDHIG